MCGVGCCGGGVGGGGGCEDYLKGTPLSMYNVLYLVVSGGCLGMEAES